MYNIRKFVLFFFLDSCKPIVGDFETTLGGFKNSIGTLRQTQDNTTKNQDISYFNSVPNFWNFIYL